MALAARMEARMPEPATMSAAEAADERLMSRRVAQAVRRAQAGDRDALAFLYARYADNVYGYVRSIVHDPHEAEDVTQQVFAKLMRVIGKYEEREVPFFAWVLRVARNLAVDHLRRQRSIPVEEVRIASSEGADPAAGRHMTSSARRSRSCRAISARCSCCATSRGSPRRRSRPAPVARRARSTACTTARAGRSGPS